MELIWILWLGGYSMLVLLAWYKWVSISPTPTVSVDVHNVSVVIPARNEADNLGALLHSLALQSYHEFEIIIVDDHSEDETILVVQEAMKLLPSLQLLCLPPGKEGKKQALTFGIQAARGELILTTDADCSMHEHWVSTMSSVFGDPWIQLAFGPVTYRQQSRFEKFQALEFWSLICVGGVSWQIGSPSMCNGANLAFRKEAFLAVDGYANSIHVPSGDDEFLLHEILREYDNSAVQFVKNSDALVSTLPNIRVKDFLMQRRRWASKWNAHKRLSSLLTAVGVFVFHLGLLVGVASAFLGLVGFKVLLVGFSLKLASECVLLRSFSKYYKQAFPWGSFLGWQVVYSIYAVVIGLLVQIKGYSWKGRTIDSR